MYLWKKGKGGKTEKLCLRLGIKCKTVRQEEETSLTLIGDKKTVKEKKNFVS